MNQLTEEEFSALLAKPVRIMHDFLIARGQPLVDDYREH